MMNTNLTSVFGGMKLGLQKYSPEICLGVGITAIVAGTVLACRATLKAVDILDNAKEKIGEIEETKVNEEDSTELEETAKKEKKEVIVKTGLELAKVYLPAAAATVGGIGIICGGHHIIRKRVAGLTAAYAAIDTAFKEYRSRVKNQLGEEIDREFRFGTEETEVEVPWNENDEGRDPKEKKVKTVTRVSKPLYSDYARLFAEDNINWHKDPGMNRVFLQAQENYANELLKARGHVILNDVYDLLGFERTTAGYQVGWVLGNGDDFIDFGIFAPFKENGEFYEGYEANIWLDFNVDGVILDKI